MSNEKIVKGKTKYKAFRTKNSQKGLQNTAIVIHLWGDKLLLMVKVCGNLVEKKHTIGA